jgi:hypothetical protein
VIALALLVLGGCAPPCEQTCRKLLGCDLESPRTAQDACKVSCETEQHLYDAWDDNDKKAAFDDERRCIASSSCEELKAGACYDEDLWSY